MTYTTVVPFVMSATNQHRKTTDMGLKTMVETAGGTAIGTAPTTSSTPNPRDPNGEDIIRLALRPYLNVEDAHSAANHILRKLAAHDIYPVKSRGHHE